MKFSSNYDPVYCESSPVPSSHSFIHILRRMHQASLHANTKQVSSSHAPLAALYDPKVVKNLANDNPFRSGACQGKKKETKRDEQNRDTKETAEATNLHFGAVGVSLPINQSIPSFTHLQTENKSKDDTFSSTLPSLYLPFSSLIEA